MKVIKSRMVFNPFHYHPPKDQDIRRLSPRFEVIGQAAAERDIRIAALKKGGGQKHQQLADMLEACTKGHRCLNGACPVCWRQYRLWVVGNSLGLPGVNLKTGLILVTLIAASDAFPANQLANFSPPVAILRLRQQLRRAGLIGWAIGGVDGEFDSDRQVFQPHFHLICRDSEDAKIRQLAQHHYPTTDEVYRGCVLQPLTSGLPNAITYTAKGYWPQKARFDGNRRRHAKRLDDHLFCEWLLWRSSYELSACTFFYGIRRYGARLAVLDNCGRCAIDSCFSYEDDPIEP